MQSHWAVRHNHNVYVELFSQVLSAATIIAKHTSALCNACRIAAGKTNNPVAKRQFVQSAKDVANNTATLVKAIKVFYHTIIYLLYIPAFSYNEGFFAW